MRVDGIDHALAAVHHVQHAARNARFKRQFDEFHRRKRVLFGRLEHEGIAADDAIGNIQSEIIAEKLKGVMPAQTPIGWRSVYMSTLPATF